jgi:fructose-1-phosphate kinase PfkB-like protein
LAILLDGNYLVISPRQRSINASEAGDIASSWLGISLSDSWLEAFHWAADTSAAAGLTEDTANCDRTDIDRIYPDVSFHGYE